MLGTQITSHRYKTIKCACLLASLAVMATWTSAWAESYGIRTAGMIINPYLKQGIAYDEDPGIVSRADDEERDGFYSETRVGLQLRSLRPEHVSLSADGWWEWRRSLEDSDLDGENYGERMRLGTGDADRLALRLKQRFSHDTDYRIDPALEAGEEIYDPGDSEDLSDRYERTRNAVAAGLDRNLSAKMPAALDYEFEDTRREGSGQFDSTSHRWLVGIGRRWTDKTTFSLNGTTGYEDNESYADPVDFYGGGLGVSWLLTDKTEGFLNAGVENRERSFPRAEAAAPPPDSEDDDDDITAFVYSADMRWRVSPKTSLSLRASRSLRSSVSTAGNTRLINALDSRLSWRPVSPISLRAGFTYQNEDYQNSQELADGSEVYENRDIYRGSFGASYHPPLDWLIFSVDASYTSDSSNIPGRDRDRKRASCSLTAIY